MKYVVSYETRASFPEEAWARSLEVFGKWSPTEPAMFKELLGRIDGNGGFALVETDDPTLILKDMAPFTPWFEFKVYPCVEIADAAVILNDAVAFVGSVG